MNVFECERSVNRENAVEEPHAIAASNAYIAAETYAPPSPKFTTPFGNVTKYPATSARPAHIAYAFVGRSLRTTHAVRIVNNG
jgi:hypothetical protein